MRTNAAHTYLYEVNGRRVEVRNVPVLEFAGERRMPVEVFRVVQRNVKEAVKHLEAGETRTLNYEELR